MTKREEQSELSQDIKNIGMKIRSEHFFDPPNLRRQLRHEFMHVSDMIDEKFGYTYDRLPQVSSPVEENIIRDRYRIIWDIYIDSRLIRQGKETVSDKENQHREFEALYLKIPYSQREVIFENLWGAENLTHHDILDMANDARKVLELAEDGKGLQNVVVYIANINQGKDWNKPKEGYLLNQEGCRFIPNFFAVPKGEQLRILNSDPTLHNIHTYEIIGRARRTLFNIGQPEKGFEFTKSIRPRRGNVVKIECDAHNFMHAWIFVPTNPYFALVKNKGKELVNKEGEYKIEDIPAGTYTVKAWHPTLGMKESEVTLTAGQKMTLNFEFSPKGRK